MPDGAKRSTQRIRHYRAPPGGKATACASWEWKGTCSVRGTADLLGGVGERAGGVGVRELVQVRAPLSGADEPDVQTQRARLHIAARCCTALQRGDCEADGKTRPSCVRVRARVESSRLLA